MCASPLSIIARRVASSGITLNSTLSILTFSPQYSSFLFNVICCPDFQDSKINGPVPTGCVANSSGVSLIDFGLIMLPSLLASMESKGA